MAENKKYNLTATEGIGNADGQTPARPGVSVYFSAKFEKMPTYITKFDIIEGVSGTWNFYDVTLLGAVPNTSYTSSNSNKNQTIPNKKVWSEASLKKHWAETTPDPMEGIYQREIKSKLYNGYGIEYQNFNAVAPGKYYVLKTDDDFTVGKIDDSDIFGKITLSQDRRAAYLTLDLNQMFSGFNSDKRTVKLGKYKVNTFCIDNFRMKLPNNKDEVLINDWFTALYKPQVAAAAEKAEKTEKNTTISGSGFAISSDGLIVTNHHVVEGATSITIKGVNGDFSKSYKAKIVTDDANNDLAILKIDDLSFTSLGAIPYLINRKSSDVGSSIFVMGYPLRATMGDELKLTNGIISSKSGFQGDVTTYQISAPVQPGNSGGPVFDSNGNLIGIINARHKGAENATYAIKSSYLFNLFDLMDKTPVLPVTSKTLGKQLSEQVKIIKNFTYIIEVE